MNIAGMIALKKLPDFSCLSSVQSLSCVQLLVTSWTAAYQAFLSFTISWSLLKLTSMKLVGEAA